MRFTAASMLAVALPMALAACGSAPMPGKPLAAATVPSARAPEARPPTASGPLTAERQWLQAWFRGTPVVIADRDDGAVAVEVPRQFCFDSGRSELKPALVAVLDKVAESLRRVQVARVPVISAPDDGGSGSPTLAQERAARVQRHLQSRGVSANRLGRPTAAGSAAVQLRLEAPPPAP